VKLIKIEGSARKLPRNAVYIGRAAPGQPRSALANPFIAKSRAPKVCHTALIVPDESVLERYRRHLCMRTVEHFAELEALRGLTSRSTLACWCVSRPAKIVGAGHLQPDPACHGDVIFTVWTALERLNWDVPKVDFQRDMDAANAAWSRLYLAAFGEPMTWGGR